MISSYAGTVSNLTDMGAVSLSREPHQEANRWHNVLKTRTAAGLGVAAETSGVVLESATKTFSRWGRSKKTRAEGGGTTGEGSTADIGVHS